jgi:HPt (histidine-containing phosphotransfer) domain-containing protein
MSAATRAGDASALERAAHKLKGAMRNLGGKHQADWLEGFEMQGKVGRLVSPAEVDRLVEQIQLWLDTAGEAFS